LLDTIDERNNFVEKWGLVRIDTDELIYNFICHQFSLSGLKVIISDDGKNIILINWYLEIDWNNDNEQIIKNKNVLKFYYLGEEIKRYKLSDVFNNISKGIQTESHLQWTRYNYDRNSIIMESDQIMIKTLELYEYRFDIKSGNMINKRKIE
jgi:hypothetical protein